jgi:hypothetical protein
MLVFEVSHPILGRLHRVNAVVEREVADAEVLSDH